MLGNMAVIFSPPGISEYLLALVYKAGMNVSSTTPKTKKDFSAVFGRVSFQANQTKVEKTALSRT